MSGSAVLPASVATTTTRAASVWVCLAIVGTMLNTLAYQSWPPLFVAAVLYGAAYAVLRLTPFGGREELRTFNACLATAWFTAGVAAVYMHFAHDLDQMRDAENFYILASDPDLSVLGLGDLGLLTSGAGAVMLWRRFYDFFSLWGLERGRYIGIAVNSLAVALNSVVAVKIARELFGDDRERLKRLTVILAACGLYALYASIHIRDALVLLTISALTYIWTRYLSRSGAGNLLLVIAATVLTSAILPFLREQFFFVPIAVTMAGVAAILLFDPARSGRRGFVVFLFVIGLIALAQLLLRYRDAVGTLLITAPQNYESGADAVEGSLGYAIVVAAPFPLNVLAKAVLIFVYPVPVWTGFQFQSVYQLFKSVSAIYFYALMPLVILAVSRVLGNRNRRTPAMMFLVFVAIGSTCAVAATSGENRHFGAFLVSLQVLALVPNLQVRSEMTAYRNCRRLFMAGVVSVHVAWAILKFTG